MHDELLTRGRNGIQIDESAGHGGGVSIFHHERNPTMAHRRNTYTIKIRAFLNGGVSSEETSFTFKLYPQMY